MTSPFSLEGKTIIVTGASSGIGRQCAISCSHMGAKVMCIGRNEQRLQDTLAHLAGDGHAAYSYDLSQTHGIAGLVADIVAAHGKLDGLLCAAGIERTAPIKLLTVQDYAEIMQVNTLSAFELARHATAMKHFNRGGAVVLIASITATIARTGTAAYSASKGALISAARVMAAELAKRQIRVNCISPGTILTPLMQNALAQMSDEDRARRVAGFPLGLGEPADVANAAVYLLSEASRWITGQNLIVDGGFTIQ